ncbi:putative membrane protein [Hoeflea phototrophica DFL-43]|jgi:putative oxidoreductase|uniref:Putative membrane protein n=1 Tax=Hoeflea phototrophica (strain DSM 17068 / NCIMB 14078 / DFL-43) TaxID=411684 RepID=A9D0C8_HOEPD|nr:DoxX family protein [Hoeflea phototrophica]EDQ34972.1 putative membrane protein [Hoeflea phototrophica DFL-43]
MSSNLQLLVARILLSVIFITAGYGKLNGVEGTAGYMSSLGIPLASVTVWLVIALELLGGLAILAGFFTRYVAWALAAFCIASGFLAHFQPEDQMQMIMFMKNLAITGGFLALAVSGPGAWSVDARRA